MFLFLIYFLFLFLICFMFLFLFIFFCFYFFIFLMLGALALSHLLMPIAPTWLDKQYLFCAIRFFFNFNNFWHTFQQSSGQTSEQTAGQSSGSNFQWSNRQRVQFNSDLIKQKQGFLYRNCQCQFNCTVLIKLGEMSGENLKCEFLIERFVLFCWMKKGFVFNFEQRFDENIEPIIFRSFSKLMSVIFG